MWLFLLSIGHRPSLKVTARLARGTERDARNASPLFLCLMRLMWLFPSEYWPQEAQKAHEGTIGVHASFCASCALCGYSLSSRLRSANTLTLPFTFTRARRHESRCRSRAPTDKRKTWHKRTRSPPRGHRAPLRCSATNARNRSQDSARR